MTSSSNSICLPLMDLTLLFSTDINSIKLHKNTRFWILFQYRNGMVYLKESHPLLMKCFKSSLTGMTPMGGASDSIYQPLFGLVVSISHHGTLSNPSQNTRLYVALYLYHKLNAAPQREPNIDYEVFQNLPQCISLALSAL